jgi:hypothetical protein
VFAATSCSAVTATLTTERALHRAGFNDAGVSVHLQSGFTEVEVTGVAGGEDGQRAAGVVWQSFPYRLDAVLIAGDVYPKALMQAQFGPRNPVYERRTLSHEFVQLGRAVLVGLGVGGLVLSAGLVLLIIFFVRRGRKAQAAFVQSTGT